MNKKMKAQAIKILELKLGLEKTFRREVKEFFANQVKNYRSGNKEIVSIRPLLEVHYERIIRRLINMSKKQNIIEKIVEGIKTFLNGHAEKQAKYIDETTKKNIDSSRKLAEKLLTEDDKPLPDEGIVDNVTSRILATQLRGRVSEIAVSETQTVTEGARSTIVQTAHKEMMFAILQENEEYAKEISEISGDMVTSEIVEKFKKLSPFLLMALLNSAVKTWVTMGDSRVRVKPYNHREANGQQVKIGEPFFVSGQLLKFPGDSSLGASLGNIIGCRCVVIY